MRVEEVVVRETSYDLRSDLDKATSAAEARCEVAINLVIWALQSHPTHTREIIRGEQPRELYIKQERNRQAGSIPLPVSNIETGFCGPGI